MENHNGFKNCPACGRMLRLPTEYLDAVANIRKEVEKFVRCDTCPECENGWISVEDRLPPYDQYVLVYYDKLQLRPKVLWFSNVDLFGVSNSNVTHWRPLPAPPEDEG